MTGDSTPLATVEQMQRRAGEHHHRFASAGDVQLLVHGSRFVQQMNSKFALWITLAAKQDA